MGVPLRGELPRFVVPSKKLTVPVGCPLKPCDVTVALKVTVCPKLDGLDEETIAVVVGPMLVFMSTPTAPFAQFPLVHSFATSRSGFPSAFTSATATELAGAGGPVPPAATQAASPLWSATSSSYAVNQLLTSVVRKICTLRSVGAGDGRPPRPPGGYRATDIPTAILGGPRMANGVCRRSHD
jgi:hypothetical protein